MQMLGVQQTSGQISYINGVVYLNYAATDIAQQIALYEEFNRQITMDKDGNANVEKLFPNGIVPESTSGQYDAAFVAWYYSGLGDAHENSGLDRFTTGVGEDDSLYKALQDRIDILRKEKENGGLIIYE